MQTLLRPAPAAGPAISAGLASFAGPASSVDPVLPGRAGPAPVGPAELAAIVGEIAACPGRWRPIVRFTEDHRWYYRLDPAGPDASYEVWLLSWLPGQRTGFHDHGEAVGAFAVADGQLRESTARLRERVPGSRLLTAGAVRSFGSAYLHDVANISAQPAVSVHAYSPPLSLMRRYEMTSAGLTMVGTETADEGW